jgi:hypothetical protein
MTVNGSPAGVGSQFARRAGSLGSAGWSAISSVTVGLSSVGPPPRLMMIQALDSAT